MTDITKQLADALRGLDAAFCADDYGTREGRDSGRKALIAAREALAAYEAQAATAADPVAWVSLTANGQIAYFDGKPMVMPGRVGNDCHPTPLYAAPVAQAEP